MCGTVDGERYIEEVERCSAGLSFKGVGVDEEGLRSAGETFSEKNFFITTPFTLNIIISSQLLNVISKLLPKSNIQNRSQPSKTDVRARIEKRQKSNDEQTFFS